MDTLSNLLTTFMARAQIGSRRLSQRTGIPRTSIDNWRAGMAQHPNQWQPLLIIANALALTRAEATALLTAANYPPPDILAHDLPVGHPDWLHLQPWLTALPSEPMAESPLPLHQLRAPVADFVGRSGPITTLVTAIRAAVGNGAIATISGVRGMGGIGKTELAYMIATYLTDTFPDAQIVVPLRGTSTRPLSAEQALQLVIRTFTPDVQLPEDLFALQQRYCAILHGRSTLILADDARDAAQVQPLMPPPGCALLVTSRQRFSLPGMLTIDIEPLTETEAITFLCLLCPRLDVDEARTIAQLCGSLPLALRVSGSILHNSAALPGAEYIQQLKDETQRLAQLRDPEDGQLNVEASLTLSYALLDATGQRVFRQLGVLEADFTTELALAVVEVDAGVNTKNILHLLLRRNLAMYDGKSKRWRLHDLVRDLARQLLDTAGETEANQWRYAQTAVQLAQDIHERYLADGTKILENLARFDAERPHFDATWTWGTAHAGTPDGDRLMLAITLATAYLNELRSDVERERIPQQESALVAAQRLGERFAEGRLLLSLGRATFDLGRFRYAIVTWERALDIFQELGDCRNEGLTLGNLGTAYARLGDPLRAIAAYEKALALFRALDDQRLEGHALGNLGVAYAQHERTQTAIPYLEKALAYAHAVRDRRFEAMLLHTLGDVARTMDLLERARSMCEEALAIMREIGDRRQEAYTLMTLGRTYAASRDHAPAISVFDQALMILQEIEDRWGVAECRWHYGLALVAQGDHDQALPLLRASVAYLTEIEHARATMHMALLARLEAGGELPSES